MLNDLTMSINKAPECWFMLNRRRACGKEITLESFLSNMTKEQKDRYDQILEERKKDYECPSCHEVKRYHEKSTLNFLHCKKCNTNSCTICK